MSPFLSFFRFSLYYVSLFLFLSFLVDFFPASTSASSGCGRFLGFQKFQSFCFFRVSLVPEVVVPEVVSLLSSSFPLAFFHPSLPSCPSFAFSLSLSHSSLSPLFSRILLLLGPPQPLPGPAGTPRYSLLAPLVRLLRVLE